MENFPVERPRVPRAYSSSASAPVDVTLRLLLERTAPSPWRISPHFVVLSRHNAMVAATHCSDETVNAPGSSLLTVAVFSATLVEAPLVEPPARFSRLL